MPNTILACRRICCGRKAKTRSKNPTVNQESSPNKSSSNKIALSVPSEGEENTNIFSPTDQLIHPDLNIEAANEPDSISNQLYKTQSNIDLERLAEEYLETINEYRLHLGFLALELSNELTNRALQRATQLSRQNRIENTSQFDLIHNNEPIGETVMSCRAPVRNGHDIAQLLHDQLVNDLKNGHSSKKRYTPILNPDCQYLGFGLIHNEDKSKDFIVIYYYPVKINGEQ